MGKFNLKEIKSFLDEKANQYENSSFISSDPIQIPHQFTQKEDIEIAAFLTATIAWGQRKTIINSANKMMSLLENSPHDFILSHSNKDLQSKSFLDFKHRTFNGLDFCHFLQALQYIYKNCGGLENLYSKYSNDEYLHEAIHNFKKIFFSIPHPARTQKHVADPLKNSAAKRIYMFLRWMVRENKKGVDFGLWKTIKPSQLSCPLDLHSGVVARKLGLIKRKANDFKSLLELDTYLRKMDKEDPVKYDFALFGLSVFEKF